MKVAAGTNTWNTFGGAAGIQAGNVWCLIVTQSTDNSKDPANP
jgi:hypothetical protein